MIRVMLDSDQPAVLLGSKAQWLATYADLLTPQLHAALIQGGRQLLVIDRGDGDPLGLATALDAGEGRVPLTEAPAWFDEKSKTHPGGLVIYHNRSQTAQVEALMGHRSYFTWMATLDGTAWAPGWTAGQGPAIVQCLDASQTGIHADLSLIYSDYFMPAPDPRQALRDRLLPLAQELLTLARG